ncbi:MAG: hypothetical protein QXR40_06185, partial [Candidatus Bathyarchaeia archaeon]
TEMIEEIFGDEEKSMLSEAERLAKLLRKEIARARQAGLDVTEQEKTLSELEVQIRKIKQTYLRR